MVADLSHAYQSAIAFSIARWVRLPFFPMNSKKDEIFSAPSVQAQPGCTPFRSSRAGGSLFERKAE
jgi:hypothetical protein